VWAISDKSSTAMRVIVFFGLIVLISCSDKKDIDKLNLLKRGNKAYTNNDLKEAMRYYDEAITKDSAFVDAWNNKGLVQMKQGMYDEAIYSFDRAVEYKPGYGEALLNNARANLAVHQHFAALEQLAELKKIWPDTSVLHFTLGLIHSEMGEDDTALEDFKKARKADSTNAEILVNMANIYYHEHKSDSAIKYLRLALEIEAGQPHAYNILAMVYAYQKRYLDALEEVNKAVSLAKNDPYFVNNKGFILLKLDKLVEAEETIVQSMKMDPYNAWVYRNLGLLRYMQNNYPESVRLLLKALGMDSNIDNIYVDLARAYHDMGDNEKACEILKQAPADDEVVISAKEELCR
jgi:FimV-like protein